MHTLLQFFKSSSWICKNNLNLFKLMRLKITISESSKHDDICTSVAWSSSNELTR